MTTINVTIFVLLMCTAIVESFSSGRSQQHDLKLEKIILFSRHGIRTPYGAKDMGQKSVEVFSTRPNAQWGDDKNTGGRNAPCSNLPCSLVNSVRYPPMLCFYSITNILSGANLALWGAKVDQGLTMHGATVLNRMGQFYASELKAIGALITKRTKLFDIKPNFTVSSIISNL